MPDVTMENGERKEKDVQYYWDKFLGFCKDYVRLVLILTGLSVVSYVTLPTLLNLAVTKTFIRYINGLRIDLFVHTTLWVILLVSVVRVVCKFIEKKVPTERSAIITVVVIINYYLYARQDINTNTANKHFFACFTYLDIVVLSVLLYGVTFIRKRKNLVFNAEKPKFLGDEATAIDKIGLLKGINGNENSLLTTICNTISNTNIDESFSIAITGPWGSGKTSFLLQLQKQLTTDDYIVISLNPWEIAKEPDDNEYFFSKLLKAVKVIDNDLYNSLENYSEYFSLTDGFSKWKTVIYKAFGTYFPRTNAEYKKLVNDSIVKSGRRVIIFIDDLDRLQHLEIINTFKLIRGVANFKNTFFITAFDYAQVSNTILKDTNISENYLEKFFQITIPLPPLNTSVMFDYFKNTLSDSVSQEEKKRIISEIDILERKVSHKNHESYNIFELHLKTPRAVKKYINSFLVSYEMLKHDVLNVRSLLLLELIKLCYPAIYQQLSQKKYLETANKNGTVFYRFNSNTFDNDYPSEEKKSPDYSVDYKNNHAKEVLNLLFPSEHQERSISDPRHFLLYFYYQLFDNITHKEYLRFLDVKQDERQRMLDNWKNEKRADIKVKSLVTLIKQSNFDETGKLTDIISILLRNYSPYENPYKDFIYDCFDVSNISDDNVDLKKVFDSIVKSEQIPSLSKAEFLNRRLKKEREGNVEKQISLSVMQEMLLQVLSDHIAANDEKYDPIVGEIFTQTIDYYNVSSLNEKMKEKAFDLYRGYLINHKEAYAKYMLFYSNDPYHPLQCDRALHYLFSLTNKQFNIFDFIETINSNDFIFMYFKENMRTILSPETQIKAFQYNSNIDNPIRNLIDIRENETKKQKMAHFVSCLR